MMQRTLVVAQHQKSVEEMEVWPVHTPHSHTSTKGVLKEGEYVLLPSTGPTPKRYGSFKGRICSGLKGGTFVSIRYSYLT